jgi:hypothetical protein
MKQHTLRVEAWAQGGEVPTSQQRPALLANADEHKLAGIARGATQIAGAAAE